MDDIAQEQTEVQDDELDQEDDPPKQQQLVMNLRPRETFGNPTGTQIMPQLILVPLI